MFNAIANLAQWWAEWSVAHAWLSLVVVAIQVVLYAAMVASIRSLRTTSPLREVFDPAGFARDAKTRRQTGRMVIASAFNAVLTLTGATTTLAVVTTASAYVFIAALAALVAIKVAQQLSGTRPAS